MWVLPGWAGAWGCSQPLNKPQDQANPPCQKNRESLVCSSAQAGAQQGHMAVAGTVPASQHSQPAGINWYQEDRMNGSYEEDSHKSSKN